jgi:hypothetical protein
MGNQMSDVSEELADSHATLIHKNQTVLLSEVLPCDIIKVVMDYAVDPATLLGEWNSRVFYVDWEWYWSFRHLLSTSCEPVVRRLDRCRQGGAGDGGNGGT